MILTLKIIFYLCCIWLILFSLSTLIKMTIVGIEYGKAWVDVYFDNWVTYSAFIFIAIRLAGSMIAGKP